MSKIEIYLKISAYIILVISAMVLLIKVIKYKLDKNKNGIIEKEEIENSSVAYIMSFLKDTIKIITKGIVNDTGCKVTTAQKLIEKAIKNQDTKKVETEIKEDFENQEKIKEQEENDKKLELEMLKRQKLFEEINNAFKGENENA